MTMFDGRRVWRRMTAAETALGVSLLVALLVLYSPDRAAVLRRAAESALRPGQSLAAGCRREIGKLIAQLHSVRISTAQLADVRAELTRSRQKNQRLKALLEEARRRQSPNTSEGPTPSKSAPLLVAELVEARVLGRQARSYLGRRDIIDAGATSGIEPESLVLVSALMLDEGRDADVSAGDLVIAGRRIVGRIVDVGPWTSTVRRVNQAGYRDLVRLAAPDRSPSDSSALGVLEGSGQPYCRIRLIDTTVPISEGDLVYAAGEDGILPEPLVYGTVVRAEAVAAAGYWEIWMQPAESHSPAGTVAVLRASLNPARLAGKTR